MRHRSGAGSPTDGLFVFFAGQFRATPTGLRARFLAWALGFPPARLGGVTQVTRHRPTISCYSRAFVGSLLAPPPTHHPDRHPTRPPAPDVRHRIKMDIDVPPPDPAAGIRCDPPPRPGHVQDRPQGHQGSVHGTMAQTLQRARQRATQRVPGAPAAMTRFPPRVPRRPHPDRGGRPVSWRRQRAIQQPNPQQIPRDQDQPTRRIPGQIHGPTERLPCARAAPLTPHRAPPRPSVVTQFWLHCPAPRHP